ncbi:MAG: LytTR family DNA-binding domain-containing protein [Bacteroidota bacterium]
MTCLIVDDDPIARALLERFAAQHGGLTVAAVCESAIEATRVLRERRDAGEAVDLVFLDVEMPEMSGLEMAEALGDDRPQIVLVTSKEEYARDAFEVEVTDYLVKPPTYARFLKAVERAERRAEPAPAPEASGADHLFVKVDGRLVKLALADLEWVESQKDYVLFHTPEAEHLVYGTMKAVAAKLPADDFARVHRSYLVRLDKIEDVEDGSILIGRKVIPVGASHRAALLERLNTL